jgi:hypothetical protein
MAFSFAFALSTRLQPIALAVPCLMAARLISAFRTPNLRFMPTEQRLAVDACKACLGKLASIRRLTSNRKSGTVSHCHSVASECAALNYNRLAIGAWHIGGRGVGLHPNRAVFERDEPPPASAYLACCRQGGREGLNFIDGGLPARRRPKFKSESEGLTLGFLNGGAIQNHDRSFSTSRFQGSDRSIIAIQPRVSLSDGSALRQGCEGDRRPRCLNQGGRLSGQRKQACPGGKNSPKGSFVEGQFHEQPPDN